MIAPNRPVDARLVLLVLDAEDMFTKYGASVMLPPSGPRIEAQWDVRGYIAGTDALFRPLGPLALGCQRVFYGVILESRSTPGRFVVNVRGTSGLIEWIEDCEWVPMPGKRAGCVESGFFGIYDSFARRLSNGAESPLTASIASIVGSSGAVTVIGHSLGAALATYLAYDLAHVLPGQVALRAFASPHPGDETFVNAVASVVPDHIHYANTADKVPQVPEGLGYTRLPNTVDLSPDTDRVSIARSSGCLHHALSYAALLDPTVLDEWIPDQDRQYLSCITRKTDTHAA